ncbi:MAG: hypothetical protein ACRDK7_04195 [Solirubrobacteraceae bacterium]
MRAFASAMNEIFVIGAALTLLGALAAAVLVRVRDFYKSPSAVPAQADPIAQPAVS